jgi:hypothetical protein
MRGGHSCYAPNDSMVRNAPEIGGPKIREFWRELARLITLFDQCSPNTFFLWEKSANSLENGAPAANRTRDPRLRRPVIYPGELRAHGSITRNPCLSVSAGLRRRPKHAEQEERGHQDDSAHTEDLQQQNKHGSARPTLSPPWRPFWERGRAAIAGGRSADGRGRARPACRETP